MDCGCTAGGDAAPSTSSRATPPTDPTPTRWRRRAATFAQWAISLTTLTLIPKCPACVAAYVLLFTGSALPLRAAAALRWALIGLATAAVSYLLFRTTRRVLASAA